MLLGDSLNRIAHTFVSPSSVPFQTSFCSFLFQVPPTRKFILSLNHKKYWINISIWATAHLPLP